MPAKPSFVENLKKNHFWILSGLIAALALVVWFLASGALMADTKKSNATTEAKRKEAEAKAAIPFHPNDEFKKQMDELIRKRKKIIYEAWQAKFKEQWASILRWPTELPQNFRDFVEGKSLNAIEEISPESEEPGKIHAISPVLSDIYRNHVEKELPKLAHKVKAEWNPPEASGSGTTPSAIERPTTGVGEKKSLVIWDPKNEGEIRDRIRSRLNKPSNAPPTTREVLYSQEDLWVLDALMTIIAKTNGNATEHEKAPIREIRFIKLGGDAIQASGTVIRAKNAAAATTEGAPSTAAPPSAHTGSGNLAEGGMQTATADPGDGRYVDKDLQLVTGQQLREAITAVDPAKAYLAVAKRMPVRMRLIINQQRLPELLVNCGNSPLMVEVQQTRVGNFEANRTSSGGSGSAHAGITGEGAMAGVDLQQAEYPYVEVEIMGLVCIYNKPNLKKLGIDEAELAAEEKEKNKDKKDTK